MASLEVERHLVRWEVEEMIPQTTVPEISQIGENQFKSLGQIKKMLCFLEHCEKKK
jgi:hypothetical protein